MKIGRNDPCICGSGLKYKKCCLVKKENKERSRRNKKELMKNISPSDFISEPYIKCPKCKKDDGFGVSMMTRGRNYTRKCRECFYSEHFKLPNIKKEIIYLDQFVISNIMKVLDSSHSSHAKVIQEPFWMEVFKKLDRLSKYQLIICPDSFYHRDESLLSKDFKNTQRIYEHLSHGLTFYEKSYITKFQIQEHFKNFLDNRPFDAPVLDVENLFYGALNEWQGRIRVGVNFNYKQEEIENIRENRDRAYEGFKNIFSRWQKEKGKKFDGWVREESFGFGKGLWQNFINFAQRQIDFPRKYIETKKIDLNDILPPPSNDIITDMMQTLKSKGFEGEEMIKKMNEYLCSEHILQIPVVKIQSMLFASIARKASAGQIYPPSRGMFADLDIISSLLPYCDVMFIDKENAGYLSEMPLKDELNYSTKVFSLNTKNDFLSYLDDILKNADLEHMKIVREVYGKTWGEPYLEILNNK